MTWPNAPPRRLLTARMRERLSARHEVHECAASIPCRIAAEKPA